MNEPTIAAITDRVSARIPSEPGKICEALIETRDDVRTLLEENARLNNAISMAQMIAQEMKREIDREELDVVAEPQKRNFGSTGAVIGSLFDELAALKGRVSALETHAVLSLIPEEARA